MPMIQRAGKPDLHYAIDDFTDPWSNAPVLLLQHGYGRNAAYWYQWVPYLSRFYKVVRPDLRGLGRSGRNFDLTTELTLDEYLGDLRAIVADLGDQPIHYCGESMGGLIGMAFAGTYPDLVRTLSLVSAPVFIGEAARKAYACGHASWPQALREMGPLAWLQETNASTRFPPDMPQGFIDWYTQGSVAAGVEMLVAIAEVVLQADVTDFLPRIVAPVLSLYPCGGVIASDDQKKILRDKLRQVHFVHLPTAFHMIHYIKPALCAREVLAFASLADGRAASE